MESHASTKTKTVCLLLGVVAVLGLRLYLAYRYYGNFDQQSYEIVANIVRRGGNVYAETLRYNYTMIWAYVLTFLMNISDAVHLPFHFVVRGFGTLVDIADALFIGLICRRIGSRSLWSGMAIYLVNPITLGLGGFHGQFENFAILPLLAATHVYLRRPEPRSLKWVWLLGTLALLIKHNVVFGIWMLFVYAARRARVSALMMAASCVLFFMAFIPYWTEGRAGIIQNVFLYRSGSGLQGLGCLLPNSASAPIFLCLMGLMPFLARYYLRLPLAKAMELSFVALLALIYGMGKQYFLMPIIWGGFFTTGWYWLYTAVTALFMLGWTHRLGSLQMLPANWNLVWFPTMAWLLSYFLVWKVDIRQLLPSLLMAAKKGKEAA